MLKLLSDDFGSRIALKMLTKKELRRQAAMNEPDRSIEVARRVFPKDAREALAVAAGLESLDAGLRAIGKGWAL